MCVGMCVSVLLCMDVFLAFCGHSYFKYVPVSDIYTAEVKMVQEMSKCLYNSTKRGKNGSHSFES